MTVKKANYKLFDRFKPIYGLVFLSLLLSACGGKQPTQAKVTPSSVPQQTPTATALPSPTPTPQPSVLTVCTAQEPASLYRYDGRNSKSKKTIFSAFYGQAVMDFDELTVLLRQEPSFENGDIQVMPAQVEVGDVIVDAKGGLSVLKQGNEVIPFGCNSTDCVIAWDGESPLSLPYLQISYQLNDGLLWSDGEPLTAEDVLFSYQVANDKATPSTKQIFDLTESVSVENELTFIWQGVPGLGNQKPEKSFWLPLPKHQLDSYTAAELLETNVTVMEPLSWGAYRLVGWDKGEQLKFEMNPFFIEAEEAEKPYDTVIVQFISDQKSALEAFGSGQCDVLDASYALEALPAGQIPGNVHVVTPFEVGTLVFGVNPASYDDGHAAWEDERADYFGDIRTRQAIALCIDPVGLSGLLSAERLGANGATLMVNPPVLPTTDPNTLLEAVGWVDDDGDPATPRVARSTEGVADLTPFEINLYGGLGELDVQAAAEVSKRLGVCGIKVNVSNLPANQLYAPGPEGILFGRNFDLAIINWAGYTGMAHNCEYYLSNQVPSEANNWVGTNLAGYRDPAFDTACQTTQAAPEATEPTGVADPLSPIVVLDLVPRVAIWISQDGVLP